MKKVLFVCGLLLLLPGRSLIYGSETAVPALQIAEGDIAVSLYSTHRAGEKLMLAVTGNDLILVGQQQYFSTVKKEFDVTGKGDAVMCEITINPHNQLHYWIRCGVGGYEIEVPSHTVNNRLMGDDHGVVAGLGLRKIVMPYTVVTPAVTVDAGIMYRSFTFNAYQSGQSALAAIQQKLEIVDVSVAVTIGTRYEMIEPYGGLKVNRAYAILREKEFFSSAAGSHDSVVLFAGNKVWFHEAESFVIEVGVGESTQISVGLNIVF